MSDQTDGAGKAGLLGLDEAKWWMLAALGAVAIAAVTVMWGLGLDADLEDAEARNRQLEQAWRDAEDAAADARADLEAAQAAADAEAQVPDDGSDADADADADPEPAPDPPEIETLTFSGQVKDVWDPGNGTYEWLWMEVLAMDAMDTWKYQVDPRDVDFSWQYTSQGDVFQQFYDAWVFETTPGLDAIEFWITVKDGWIVSMEEL